MGNNHDHQKPVCDIHRDWRRATKMLANFVVSSACIICGLIREWNVVALNLIEATVKWNCSKMPCNIEGVNGIVANCASTVRSMARNICVFCRYNFLLSQILLTWSACFVINRFEQLPWKSHMYLIQALLFYRYYIICIMHATRQMWNGWSTQKNNNAIEHVSAWAWENDRERQRNREWQTEKRLRKCSEKRNARST